MAEHPDPASLAAAADQHGVLPLFTRSLSLAGIHCEIAQARARAIAFRNLALAAELVQLIVALRNLGIQALAYKGPILGQQLYGEITVRQFCDLDILIAPVDALRTRDALYQLRYKDKEPFSCSLFKRYLSSQCEWPMTGAQAGTTVELHWALFPPYASLDLSATELSSESVAVEIFGEHVRTFDLCQLALVLSAHGTKHLWQRLGWLVDFALVLRNYGVSDAEKLLDAASRKGMKRILLLSAALAVKVLGLEVPDAFRRAISADDGALELADQMTQVLGGSEMVSEDLLNETILLLRSRERWSDRAKIVSRLAFTPGPQEWKWIALPEWAEWLYRPIRFVRAARYCPRIAAPMFSRRHQQ